MHLVKLTNVNIAGDLVLLVAASYVYKRSISTIQTEEKTCKPLEQRQQVGQAHYARELAET